MMPQQPDSVTCGACQHRPASRIGSATLYVHEGSLPDTLWRCPECGTYIRGLDFDDPIVQTHFEVASYTDPQREQQLLESRIGFFEHIAALALPPGQAAETQPQVLDVGPAYGHLLDIFRKKGADGSAIEIVDRLSAKLRERGITTYRSAGQIPDNVRFDIITIIDSLYCLQSPADTLRMLRNHLATDGILILRVTNRAPLLDILRLLNRPITNSLVGDAKHNFSFPGIARLLSDTGFSVERVVLNERGKRIARLKTWLYYKCSLAASKITGLKLTPGMILVCRGVPTRE